MKVLKFGGTSVATARMMSKVTEIVVASARHEHVILVCSAISKCTDSLISASRKADAGDKSYMTGLLPIVERHHDIIRELLPDEARTVAMVEFDNGFAQLCDKLGNGRLDDAQSFGELFSTRIIARKLAAEGLSCLWVDSRQIIRTDAGKVITDITYANIHDMIEGNPGISVFVVPGFIASDLQGRTTTLGRGGSDYSAALYAAGTGARMLEIWTDVPGIMTSDPKKIPAARTIPYLSYHAAEDMARFGAKVIYPPTIRPAREAGIPICILNTYEPEVQGSLIIENPPLRDTRLVGLSTFGMEDGSHIISLIGDKGWNISRERAKLEGLAEAQGIPASAISQDEGGQAVFVKVPEEDLADLMLKMHRAFFETSQARVIRVFIAGHGAVAKALTDIIRDSGKNILERTGKEIRIVGVSDSRHFVIDTKGIAADETDRRLSEGRSAEGGAYLDAIRELSLRNAVFVDCTNSETIGQRYEELFRCGISVVSCNRRAFAVPYSRYAAMKMASHDNGVALKYDTTVGAALPILETIACSSYSSDRITSIEAAISCTLNYIISEYDGCRRETFATLLRRAQEEGLTEKDPRMDLGGQDALRKLLIIAREAGVPLDEKDVTIEPYLGPEFFDCPIGEFYKLLDAREPYFEAREDELDRLGKRQRFVASLHKDPASPNGYKASISMKLVDEDHPFFRLKGTDNITIIKSEFQSSPLVIQGAGEGARQAAAGVINDILML